MTKQLKAKWIEALRSGKYEQGREQLKTDNGKYCCLGVLNEIADLDYETDCGYLENHVGATWKGLDIDQQGKLVSLNDEDGKTFPEIADYIEAEVECDG